MMTKLLLGGLIAAALASGPALASDPALSKVPGADAVSGSYVALTAGSLDLGYADDPALLTGVYGVDLDGVATNLGAEVEVTGTFSDGDVLGVDVRYQGVGAYLTYGHNLGRYLGIEYLDGFARAGLAYGELEVGSISDNSVDLAYGVGVAYNPRALTRVDNFGVRVEYTERDWGDSVSAGITYAF